MPQVSRCVVLLMSLVICESYLYPWVCFVLPEGSDDSGANREAVHEPETVGTGRCGDPLFGPE